MTREIGCLVLVNDHDREVRCCEAPAVTVVHIMCEGEAADVPTCAEHVTAARRMGTTAA